MKTARSIVAADKTVNPKEVRYIFATVEKDTAIVLNGVRTVHGEAYGNSSVNGTAINVAGSGFYTAKPNGSPTTFKRSVQLSTPILTIQEWQRRTGCRL